MLIDQFPEEADFVITVVDEVDARGVQSAVDSINGVDLVESASLVVVTKGKSLYKKQAIKIINIHKRILVNFSVVFLITTFNQLNNFLFSWVMTTSHKKIGILYLILGFNGGLCGTFYSLLIRSELSMPDQMYFNGNYQAYYVTVTMHGLVMIFFMVMPTLLGGFGNYFVPLQLGTNEMAFPRLNALSF